MENKRYTCIRLQNNDKVVYDSAITRKFEKKTQKEVLLILKSLGTSLHLELHFL